MSREQRKAFQRALPGWVPSWIVPSRAIVLGLDLQGGSHVLLEVDVQDLMRTQTTQLRDDVRRVLRETRVIAAGRHPAHAARRRRSAFPTPPIATRSCRSCANCRSRSATPFSARAAAATIDVSATPDGLITLTYTEARRQRAGAPRRRPGHRGHPPPHRRARARPSRASSARAPTASWCRCRVCRIRSGSRSFSAAPAKLEFRMLAQPGAADVDMLPMKEEGGQRVPVERRVIVEGSDLDRRAARLRQPHQRAHRQFPLQRARRAALRTGDHRGHRAAARHRARQRGDLRAHHPIGRSPAAPARFPGSFTVQQVNDLSVLLRAGALPAKLTIVEERTVGPGLGQDSIEAGKKATYVATIFVVIFMFATYGLFGLFANIALLVHVGLIFGLMSVLEATLTLPGIAGIVLTIGTAVDSNVLIYERIREEVECGPIDGVGDPGRLRPRLRDHRRFQQHHGDRRRDPVLPRLRSGARLRSRVHSRHPDDGSHRRDPDAHDDRALVSLDASENPSVLRSSHRAPHPALARQLPLRLHALSALLVSAFGRHFGATVVLLLTIGLNFGIDFKGGTLMELQAKSGQADVGKVRQAADGFGFGEVEVQEFGTAGGISLRFAIQAGGEAAQSAVVQKSPRHLRRRVRVPRVETVGPRVSGELVQSGTIGIILSVIAVLFYLWFRFERELAVGAIIGTLHDIVLTLGFFVITRHEFNMTSIAAILTIVGYSLNETVVVFDRTRELMRRYKTMPADGTSQPVDQQHHVAHGDDGGDHRPVAARAGALRRTRHRGVRPGDALRRRHLHLFGDLHLVADADLYRPRAARKYRKAVGGKVAPAE